MSNFDRFFENPVYLLYKNHLYSYLVRRSAIRRSLKQKQRKVLELGCGISPMLEGWNQTTQTDLSWQGLSYLKKVSQDSLRMRPVACDARSLPFLNESFDSVICTEVLEHIEDDQKVLWEIARVTKRSGELILTCPIHQKLFGFDDQFVGHYRRYEIPELLDKLTRQGFREFQVKAVLGPLEKQLMLAATKIFLAFKGKGSSVAKEKGGILLAWILFPGYLLMNYLLAGYLLLESRLIPAEKASTVFIRCQKSS